VSTTSQDWTVEDLAIAADRLFGALRRGRARLVTAIGDDLSPTRVALLEPLLDGAELSVGALAEAAGITVPTATRQLQQLDRDGVVARHRDPADDRRVLVALTDSGRERLSAVRRSLREFQTSAYSELDPTERNQLGAAIARLTGLVERTVETERS
jgi:DNA-binding MarR family transcriptional regulator